MPPRRSPLLYGLAALWLLLWTMLSLTEVAILVHRHGIPLWHPILIALATPVVGGAWLAFALATHRFEKVSVDPPRRWFLHHLKTLPLLIIGGCIAIPLMREAVYWLIGHDYQYSPPPLSIPFDAFKITLFYCLWLALMFGLLTLEKWRLDSERMLGVQKALTEAQLAQLQAQLRPHFLFNALNTVSSLMMTDAARADRVLAQLGDLLRASLRSGQSQSAPLCDELELLEKYAEIMQERFEGRAIVHWDVDPQALDAPVPSMLLQPLLENAFKHGVERSIESVQITVRARRMGGELQVEIHNTGSNPSVAVQGAQAAGGGVGLRNCRERLRLLYGETAQLSVVDAGGGVSACVTLPCPPQAA